MDGLINDRFVMLERLRVQPQNPATNRKFYKKENALGRFFAHDDSTPLAADCESSGFYGRRRS